MTGNIFFDYLIHNFFIAGALVSFCELWRFFYYSIFWKKVVKRKAINEALENIIAVDREILENPVVYQTAKESASARLTNTMYIQEVIERL